MRLPRLPRPRPPLAFRRVSSAHLAPGRPVELPGRGTTWVSETDGPPGAPVLFLIHGLVASSYLNWFPAVPRLTSRYRVVAMDLRGHGRGIADGGRFRMVDCADDVAALADVLGVDRFIPVGYSLGGPVAQLVWHRHRERVEGLVMCATARNYGGTRRERMFFATLPLVARLPGRPRRGVDAADPVADALGGGDDGDGYLARWAIDELRRTSPRVLFQAMHELGRFTSHEWIGGVDVPTALVVTTRDRLIAPTRQLKLATAIPGATIHPIDAGHAACVLGARSFVPALLEACDSVVARLDPDRHAKETAAWND